MRVLIYKSRYHLFFYERYFRKVTQHTYHIHIIAIADKGYFSDLIRVEIPGSGLLEFEHFVTDFSGTLSEDGKRPGA